MGVFDVDRLSSTYYRHKLQIGKLYSKKIERSFFKNHNMLKYALC